MGYAIKDKNYSRTGRITKKRKKEKKTKREKRNKKNNDKWKTKGVITVVKFFLFGGGHLINSTIPLDVIVDEPDQRRSKLAAI